MLTPLQLKAILPAMSLVTGATYLPYLNKYFEEYKVNTRLRMAAFIAQVGHESGCFIYTAEIASGQQYEGRVDLGNTHPGDGRRYKGRGLIQITGRYNYDKLSKAFFNDDRLLINPALLQLPDNATRSAFWFWDSKQLNTYADKSDLKGLTKRINGGYNGLAERQLFYDRALIVLK